MFSLKGLDGSVALDGRKIKVKRGADAASGKSVVVPAESLRGVAVWTGVLGGQFSMIYAPGSAAGSAANETLTVQFAAADKDWWDAMASAIMGVVRGSTLANGRAGDGRPVADPIPPAPQAFDGWLSRTIGPDVR